MSPLQPLAPAGFLLAIEDKALHRQMRQFLFSKKLTMGQVVSPPKAQILGDWERSVMHSLLLR